MIRCNKILILCRNLEQMGGVVRYCESIFDNFDSDAFILEHFPIGKRPGKRSNIVYFFTLIYDYLLFFIKLFNRQYGLVQLNPSLGFIPSLRESLFLLIARFHSRKVLVFWHGWEKRSEQLIDGNRLVLWIFRKIYNNADAFIVLASAFKQKLSQWGFNQPIFIETTMIDSNLAGRFHPGEKVEELKGSGKLRLLFFSRIQRTKGVFETVDAFLKLDKTDRELELVIAGDGPDYDALFEYVKASGNDRITLAGYVTGAKKREVLENSHIFCLPTSHGEGLPVALLEAMAFGMPIVTCPVGGIPDILKEGENAYFLESPDTDNLTELLTHVLEDKEKMASMAVKNYELAQEKFLSSTVAGRLESIYKTMINPGNEGNLEYGPAK